MPKGKPTKSRRPGSTAKQEGDGFEAQQKSAGRTNRFAGYISYIPLPRRLTDRTLKEIRDGKQKWPTLYQSPKQWIEILLDERKRYRRIIRRLAQKG